MMKRMLEQATFREVLDAVPLEHARSATAVGPGVGVVLARATGAHHAPRTRKMRKMFAMVERRGTEQQVFTKAVAVTIALSQLKMSL